MKNKDDLNYKVYFSVHRFGFIIYTIILFVFYFGMAYSVLEPDWKPIGLKVTDFYFLVLLHLEFLFIFFISI